jgi:outer membrane protein TolC
LKSRHVGPKNIIICIQFVKFALQFTLIMTLTCRSFWILFLAVLFPGSYLTAQKNAHTVDYYLSRGLANSPLLKDIRNQARVNAIDSLLVLAAKKPQVNGTSQVLVAPVINGFGYDEAITNGGNYSAVIGVSQPLFYKKNVQNQLDNLSLQGKSLLLTARLSEDDLKKKIIAQYISAWADYQCIINSEEQIKVHKKQDVVFQQLVDRGLYKQSDYLTIKIEAQSMEVDMKQQMEQYRLDQYMLNLLCGIGDTTLMDLEKPSIRVNEIAGPLDSPLFMQFRIDSLKNSLSKNTVDLRYLPKINWFGDAGYNSSGQMTMEKNFGFSAGINVTVPIYDGGQRKQEYQKISISEETRKNYQDHFIRQYKQRTGQLKQMIRSKEELAIQTRQKIKLLQQLIDFDRQQLEAGNMAVTDYLMALRSLLDAGKNLAVLESDSLQLINELNYITLP